MIIRKIKKLKLFYVYFPLGIISTFVVRIIAMLVQYFFVQVENFIDSLSQQNFSGVRRSLQANPFEFIDSSIEIGSTVAVTGYIQTFFHEGEAYNFLLTSQGFKYGIVGIPSSLPFSNQWVMVIGEIKDFFGPIPLIKFISGHVLNYSGNPPPFLSQDQIKILLKSFSSKIPPSFRPLPSGGMSFRSQKGYTIFFPKKVFYEVVPIRETFDVPGLLCDNVVFIVGNDKKRYVEEDELYIRKNARVKIYVCTAQDRYYQLPLEVEGMQYMTTESRSKHFYIHVLHPSWQRFASQIAARD